MFLSKHPNPFLQNQFARHLITDAGFAAKYLQSLAVIVAVGLVGKYAVASNVQLKIVLQEMYDTVQWELIDAAESLSLWFLMGLFSSSCCLIQIGLNALSFGCAGFNKCKSIHPHHQLT